MLRLLAGRSASSRTAASSTTTAMRRLGPRCAAALISTATPPSPAARLGRLEGKIALITGGASGLGLASAREFIHEGAAAVYLADIDTERGPRAAEELGSRAHFVECDVTSEQQVADAVDLAAGRHSGRLDVLHNSAGIAGQASGIVELDLSQFDRVMAVNLRGTVAGIKHAARVMGPAGSGSILCVSSIFGVLAGAHHSYTTSKHAVPGIVKSAASELGRHGVRVNCISPFVVVTPMVMESFGQMYPGETPERIAEIARGLGELKGAVCEPVDIAKAAAFLASDDAKYISGHNLVVDGGFTTSKHLNLPMLDQLLDQMK